MFFFFSLLPLLFFNVAYGGTPSARIVLKCDLGHLYAASFIPCRPGKKSRLQSDTVMSSNIYYTRK